LEVWNPGDCTLTTGFTVPAPIEHGEFVLVTYEVSVLDIRCCPDEFTIPAVDEVLSWFDLKSLVV
jgi:hypothetical protein